MTTQDNQHGFTISLTKKGKRAMKNNELTGDMKAVFEQLVGLADDVLVPHHDKSTP